jgi:hypothetical protein
VSHEEAFQALRDGDFRIAIPLLEHALRETGYSSETINQAYTQALYRAGENARLANVAFEIGDSFVETDPATAMDYFQRALVGGLDASCVRHISDIFEQWAEKRPKRKAGGRAPRITKVAHVVGYLSDEYRPARQLRLLVKSLRAAGIESQVFTTEWAASWFCSPSGVIQSKTPQMVDDAVVGAVNGSFLERAERIASAIRSAGAPVAFYHANLTEQITARVAAFRPAAIQINVAHDDEMEPELFDGYIHLTKQGLAATRHHEKPCAWIPGSSDLAERIEALPSNMKQLLGLDAAETVSATFEDLRHASDPPFLDMLSRTLNAFPNHFHVFAGPGDVKNIRAHLHAEGVLPRVRFMGSTSDAESVMAVTDVYLAPETPNNRRVLDAMAAGKPVVVSVGADLPGVPQLTARNPMEYGQIVQRLLRDPEARAASSRLVLEKFRAEFDAALLGKRYKEFLKKIVR